MTKGQDTINVFIQVMEEQGRMNNKPVFEDFINVMLNISDKLFDEMLEKYNSTHILKDGKAIRRDELESE